MVAQHDIAAISNGDGVDAQALLAGIAARLTPAGTKVVGILAEDHGLPDRSCNAGFLRDIATGRRFAIYLEKPRAADTSCHLDPDGVQNACTGLLEEIPAADLVLLSKFGKLEAARQGLWPAFAAAIAAGKPTLTTVSPRHVEALRMAASGTTLLKGDASVLEQWWASSTSRR